MGPAAKPAVAPELPHHVLQLHGGDGASLTRSVGRYLSEGLAQGDSLLVIAASTQRQAFVQEITAAGYDAGTAVRDRRLLLLDAEETLARFLVNGEPNWERFVETIEAAIGELEPQADRSRIRAYGEMVDLLWNAGQLSAAIRLEEFWSTLVASMGFKLFCAYSIDIFGEEFQAPAVKELLRAHTHVVPCGQNGSVEIAVDRAMQDILGSEAGALPPMSGANNGAALAIMPRGEGTILSLRSNLPQHADAVLSRARQHYQSERRFQALVENSSDAIFLASPEGKVLYASASTARLLGYSAQELVGRNALELIHPEDLERTNDTLQRVLRIRRSPVGVEVRVGRKDGMWCWIESTMSNLLHEPDIRAIVVNYRDVTERKTAEQERRRNLEDLARSNAELKRLNDDLNQFAYSASHDLQEPLRMMAIYSQMLERKYKGHLDEDAQRYIQEIVLGAQRMNALLKDLLAYTRAVNISNPENIVGADANAVLHIALCNLNAAIEESGAEIIHDILPVLKIREVHLVQVFQNLLGNAIKYRSKAMPRIEICAVQRGTNWELAVKDNGIGVPPQYADQIFRVFRRLHHSNEYEGTGIGLAICQRIIERYGGRIWVDSPQEQGSIFRFTLPAA
jgi:PAS domain S-box-containing protein